MREMAPVAMSFAIPPVLLEPRRNPSLVHIDPPNRQMVALRIVDAIERIIREEAGVRSDLEVAPAICPGCSQIMLSDVFDIMARTNGWKNIEDLRSDVGLVFLGLKDPEEMR